MFKPCGNHSFYFVKWLLNNLQKPNNFSLKKPVLIAQNAGNSPFGKVIFKNFPGEHAPGPP